MDNELTREGVANALMMVENVRSRIPSWQRALAAAGQEAAAKTPDWEKVKALLTLGSNDTPGHAAGRFMATDKASSQDAKTGVSALSTHVLLGLHGDLLVGALGEAQSSRDSAKRSATAKNATAFASDQQRTSLALALAMQHALFLTFLSELSKAHVGARRVIDDYCQGWGLSTAQVDTLWMWLTHDPLPFGTGELALDPPNRCGYRKADKPALRYLTANAIPIGGVITFGVVALLFAVLHSAGVTKWPANWGWKLVVLVLFVSIGAWMHLGSRVLNINYSNPMSVYDAGSFIDWLSLRWLAVLQMYIPVGVVVASLWGAGNIPGSFGKLGTAILAGYSADSFTRAAVSKVSSGAGSKQAAVPATKGTPSSAVVGAGGATAHQ